MKILIEGYNYDPEVVRTALPGNYLLLTNKKVKVEYVGYYHNARSTEKENDDFVFFLPKVVLNKDDRVFVSASDPVGFSPEEIVDPENVKAANGKKLSEEQLGFLYNFSVWIYRALAHYVETHAGTDAVFRNNDRRSGAFRRKYVTNTFLDVILAMLRFNRENHDYFLFRIKEKHSGLNKISWPRTIARSQAIVVDGVPTYFEPINKKRAINFDEELLVIYYSILNHICVKYGFRSHIGFGYELITGDRFVRYLNGYGIARLRQIKYKFFSDRDLTLWELCFAFFDMAHKANVSVSGEDYLLSKDFEKVFESMVDELVGDPELAKYKDLDDGKEIDHLYIDESLTRTDEWRTLCIADSKYYKIGNSLETKSVAKQFTYARDMLQLDLDLFLYGGENVTAGTLKKQKPFENQNLGLLRDDVTEGYDVIPNFFISATMDPGLSYDKDGLIHRPVDDGGEHLNIHFENRLFDRDTLILAHFDVNFLFVLKMYVRNDDSARSSWREHARCKFRDEIRSIISHRYRLCALMPHDGVDAQQFFQENFRYTAGKVYAPYPDAGGRPVYALALQRPAYIFEDKRLTPEGREEQMIRIEAMNKAVVDIVSTSFYIVEDVAFGVDPRPELLELLRAHQVVHGPVADVLTGVQVVSKVSGPFTHSIRNTRLCPCPESQCPNADAVKVLVVPYTQGAHLYHVVDGSSPVKMSKNELNDVGFVGIDFPDDSCWVWQVEI